MSAFDAAGFESLRRGAWGARPVLRGRVGSTQDLARAALEAGNAGEGLLVLAEAQDAGRGRWGRRWEAGAGQSLLFSVVLTGGPGRGTAQTLPLVLGAAAVAALRGLGLADAGLKWPNDLLDGRGRKLGGLLVEGVGAATVAGCGLNVAQADGDFPPDLRGQAASLRMAGLAAGREAVLAAVLAAWEAWVGRWRSEGFAVLRGEVEALDRFRGRRCAVRQGGERLEGRVLGLRDDGALRLGLDDGREKALHSAEIEQLRPSGPD